MKKAIFLLLAIIPTVSFSQSKHIILHSNIMTFEIKDIDVPEHESTWTLTPNLNPDVLSTTSKEVWFCTDVDTLKIKVSKKKPQFDFVVIYNKVDTFPTRVQFEEVIDYLGKLKKASKYNPSDKRVVPAFTYQDMNHPDLVALKNEYNLDSIAGTASDVHQLLNLMHWIHTKVKHDGSNGNPDTKNAKEMISACRDNSRGLNCRGLAISLNECYLALGFKSRYVTCMPKDAVFDDCHVINMVFVPSLKKWIYLDPTHDAYVMDEKGNLLGIEEVRERLINNKTLILNPSANWNNVAKTIKSDYLYYYMAKNLYRLECPVSSEYNLETKTIGKNTEYIELLPLDALPETSKKEEFVNTEFNSKMTSHKTNNPSLFWKIP